MTTTAPIFHGDVTSDRPERASGEQPPLTSSVAPALTAGPSPRPGGLPSPYGRLGPKRVIDDDDPPSTGLTPAAVPPGPSSANMRPVPPAVSLAPRLNKERSMYSEGSSSVRAEPLGAALAKPAAGSRASTRVSWSPSRPKGRVRFVAGHRRRRTRPVGLPDAESMQRYASGRSSDASASVRGVDSLSGGGSGSNCGKRELVDAAFHAATKSEVGLWITTGSIHNLRVDLWIS